MKSLSHVWLFATPWTVAYQAPLSMEFSRQEYWSGLLFPFPGDPPNPGIGTWVFLIAGRCFTIWATREAQSYQRLICLTWRVTKKPGHIRSFHGTFLNLLLWSTAPHLNHNDDLPLSEADIYGRGSCVLRSLLSCDNLQQLHLVHRREVVHADHLARGTKHWQT